MTHLKIPVQVIKTYGGVKVQLHSFVTSPIFDGTDW